MKSVLTIRSHSGLSGDMLLTGLAVLALAEQGISPAGPESCAWLSGLCAAIRPELVDCLQIREHFVNGIAGWQARIDLPHEHVHRHGAEIQAIIEKSQLGEAAKKHAVACFRLLAECEASVHGMAPDEIHFHEVGALDSILDICAVCELYERLGEPRLVASPLPVADGEINCAHGILPAPAPAVLRLMQDVPVYPFAGRADAGELVTPTAMALLRCLAASFGVWPAFVPRQTCLVYGSREFEGTANGVIFAIGSPI